MLVLFSVFLKDYFKEIMSLLAFLFIIMEVKNYLQEAKKF